MHYVSVTLPRPRRVRMRLRIHPRNLSQVRGYDHRKLPRLWAHWATVFCSAAPIRPSNNYLFCNPLLAHSGHAAQALQRSLLGGVKRACLCALHMSADDPKRTSAPFGIRVKVATICCPSLGGDNEAARVHYASWWRRGDMAAHGERAARSDTGYRISRSTIP